MLFQDYFKHDPVYRLHHIYYSVKSVLNIKDLLLANIFVYRLYINVLVSLIALLTISTIEKVKTFISSIEKMYINVR